MVGWDVIFVLGALLGCIRLDILRCTVGQRLFPVLGFVFGTGFWVGFDVC